MLSTQLDLLFGQHLATLASCAVYGVARAYSVPLSFKRICTALVKHFPMLSQCMFQQVELCSGLDELEVAVEGSGGQHSPTKAFYGELRIFYNTKFLPRMQSRLLDITPKPPSSGKPKSRGTRLPLKALSAQDINVRQGNAQ